MKWIYKLILYMYILNIKTPKIFYLFANSFFVLIQERSIIKNYSLNIHSYIDFSLKRKKKINTS